MKIPFIIDADLESLIEKINTCHNNPEKSSTTKIWLFIVYTLSFDSTKNKLDYHRGKNCMKNFCLD